MTMLKEECNAEMMKLDYDLPEDFIQFVCQTEIKVSLLLVAFERILGLYLWGVLVASMVLHSQDKDLKVLIYFEFWTLLLSILIPEVWFCIGAQREQFEEFYWDQMPRYLKFRWALLSAVLPSVLLSSLVFWTQSYPKISHPLFIVVNVATPVLWLLHFAFLAYPLRLLHFYFFVIFYILYIIFSLIYHSCGGAGSHGATAIYPVLNWKNPGKAILSSFIGLLVGLLFHCLLAFMSMGKLYLRERYVLE